MNEQKHLYETTFIVNAVLEDPQVDAIITRTQEIITRNGGEIKAINKWGRKRLAYTIQKKNNGYYVNIEFTDTGSAIPQVERTFLLDENILRFLTIHISKKALKAHEKPPPIEISEEIPSIITESVEVSKEPLFDDDIDETVPPII